MRLAPFTGVYGLSFVFALMAAALALAVLRRPRVELLWLAPILLLVLLPPLPPAERGRETALLVQPNISETEQWTAESVDAMKRRQVMLSLRGALSEPGQPPSIIVWPEVPAPFYYYEDPVLPRLCGQPGAGRARRTCCWASWPTRRQGAPLNSAVLVSPEGAAGQPLRQGEPGAVRRIRAVAVRLLPTRSRPRWAISRPGNRVVVSPVGAHKIGTFICYESVFPNFVRKFAAGGAEVLFNISNDGWFGKSAARAAASEHGAHARRRESPLDSALHQRRHHGDHRFGRPPARHAAAVYRGDVVHRLQLRPGADGLYALRRLVPAALRDGRACWGWWRRRSPIIVPPTNCGGSPGRRRP